MLAALKFVQGAIAKKGFTPELNHFRIENGTIKGFNGTLALSSPIALDLDVTPKAIPFVKAIAACRATTAMSITPAGRLSVKSGKFKAFVECIEEVYPDVYPEGEMIELTSSFIGILKELKPFISADASRPWSRGVLFRGRSAYATNNIIVVETWLPNPFPIEVNIPAPAVNELIRIKDDPVRIQVSDKSMTFHYEDGRWLRTALLDLAWPDMSPIFSETPNAVPLPSTFFAALEDIKPFTDEVDRVIFQDGIMTTSDEEGVGASVEMEDFPYDGVFNLSNLQLIETVVDRIDFSMYPKPCIFFGGKLRGAIVGMIKQ